MSDRLEELTVELLEQGYLMSLATTDAESIWVADVIYVHDDDLNVYWMSNTRRRHSQAIDGGHPDVAATITVTQGPQNPDLGLQMSGTAARVENPSPELLKQWFRKKQKPEMLAGLAKLVLDEHEWYKLTPDCIELIHQPEFGYDRQTVR